MQYRLYLQTFGCQMNVADSEYLASLLLNTGNFEITTSITQADIIVINTCSVRKHAEDRAESFIGQLKKFKIKKEKLKIIVIGCFAQRAKSELQKKYPFIDVIAGPLDYEYLPEILSNTLGFEVKSVKHHNTFNKVSVFVPIMTGCNNFCSYCIVPYVRGKEKSRPFNEVIEEIEYLVENGTKEVILIGQNVNSYSGIFNDGKEIKTLDFAKLLSMVANLKTRHRFWLRFLTNHPKDMNYEIIETIKKHPNISRHIHLPLQSGSDRILQLMNRNYTLKKYKEIIKMIISEIPEISITTDLIVGFPTETDDDFQKTIEAVEEIRFDSAFVFKYSPRKGTKAYELPDDVPQSIKEERHHKLLSLCDSIAKQKNSKYVNSKQEVLIISKNNNYFIGKTLTNKTVEIITNSNLEIGSFTTVNIESIKNHTLIGKL